MSRLGSGGSAEKSGNSRYHLIGSRPRICKWLFVKVVLWLSFPLKVVLLCQSRFWDPNSVSNWPKITQAGSFNSDFCTKKTPRLKLGGSAYAFRAGTSAPHAYNWFYLDSSLHRTLYEHAINRLLRLTLGSQKNGLSQGMALYVTGRV